MNTNTTTRNPAGPGESKAAASGRIARLPSWLREMISVCLQSGPTGAEVLEGLNARPEFQTLLKDGEGCAPLTEADIAEWREHGFEEWAGDQEIVAACRAMAREVEAVSPAGAAPLTDRLAAWAAVQYVAQSRLLRESTADPDTARGRLREFTKDVALLRRGDQNAQRISIEKQWLALEERDSMEKFKKKTIIGLETLMTCLEKSPEAKAAFDSLAKQILGPLDKIEEKP